MNRVPILPAPALRAWVSEFARESGFERFHLVRTHKGGQALTFVFEVHNAGHDGGRFVLKSFVRDHAVNPAGAVRREYQALGVLHSALLAARIGVVSAGPLSINEEEWAYLCEYLDGKPLSRSCDPGKLAAGTVPGRLVSGLEIFYEAVGGPYGDFKPSNVLVHGDTVGMIDPITPDPRVELVARQGAFAPASGDLGYWVYGLAIDTLVGVLRGRLSPSELPRQICFGRMLVTEAGRHLAGRRRYSGFLDEVEAAARQHFIFLRREGSRRQQFLANAGLRVLAVLLGDETRSLVPATAVNGETTASLPTRETDKLPAAMRFSR